MKKKYLVATHGELAKGFQSSLNILADRGDELTVINAYMTDEDFTPAIIQFIESVGEEEQGLIFTDLFGGSVNQKVVMEVLTIQKDNVFVISNANLAIVLSLLFLAEDQVLSDALIQEMITESQVQLVQTTIS